MRAALDEREALSEARADAVLEAALTESTPWTEALGAPPSDRRRAETWRRSARVVAAYRARYRITDDAPLSAPPESVAQKIDAARARSAFERSRGLSWTGAIGAASTKSHVRTKLPSTVGVGTQSPDARRRT